MWDNNALLKFFHFSLCILREEAPTVNAASVFVGNKHIDWKHSSSSATRAHKLRNLSSWVLPFTLKSSEVYKLQICVTLKSKLTQYKKTSFWSGWDFKIVCRSSTLTSGPPQLLHSLRHFCTYRSLFFPFSIFSFICLSFKTFCSATHFCSISFRNFKTLSNIFRV